MSYAQADPATSRGPTVAARLFLARLPDETVDTAAALEDLSRALPAASRNRLARYRNARAALHSAAAETIVRIAASAAWGADLRAQPWTVAAQGKPYWPDCPLSFSLSHTDGLVAACLAPADVGVDVERVRPVSRRLAERFCSPDECARLCSLPESGRLAAFFDLWTLKESYAKATGRGISLRFSSFTVADFSAEPHLQGSAASEWRLRRYGTGRSDERLAVCARPGAWSLPAAAVHLSFAALRGGELTPDPGSSGQKPD